MGTFTRWLSPVHAATGLTLLAAPLRAQTLQAIAASEPPRIQIFLSGSLRDVVGQEGGGSTGTGALGMRYIGPAYVATGLINVAGSFDTLTSGVGSTMLPPANGRGFNAGLLDIRRRYLFGRDDRCGRVARLAPTADTLRAQGKPVPVSMQGRLACALGLHTYIGVSTGRWATALDPATDTVTETIDVPVWGAGIGLTYTFIDRRMEDKDVAMVLDAGIATRHLRGDLAADRRDALRTTLLGTAKRNFYGPEVGLGLQYENITASLTYYFFGSDIDGFSHGQVVAGVSIQASLNDWRLGPAYIASADSAARARPASTGEPAPAEEPAPAGEPARADERVPPAKPAPANEP
jgi:hypothetical protein